MRLKWNEYQVLCYSAGEYLINDNVAVRVTAEMYHVFGNVSHALYWIIKYFIFRALTDEYIHYSFVNSTS